MCAEIVEFFVSERVCEFILSYASMASCLRGKGKYLSLYVSGKHSAAINVSLCDTEDLGSVEECDI